VGRALPGGSHARRPGVVCHRARGARTSWASRSAA
jgi:hypothetical protein